MGHIAIFDGAIKRPSHHCYNRLVRTLKTPFTYHRPSTEGLSSILKDTQASGYIIFGSASNVEDRLDWHKGLANFCHSRLSEGQPVLGLCFGHQLMADFYGLNVEKNPSGHSYYGTRDVLIRNNYGLFKKGETYKIFTAHSFSVTSISEDFIHLGESEECSYDALAHKTLPYFGFQGHPEASSFFVNEEIREQGGQVDQPEEELALRDGLNVIQNFVAMVEKSQRNL